jgi:hypothetical protein
MISYREFIVNNSKKTIITAIVVILTTVATLVVGVTFAAVTTTTSSTAFGYKKEKYEDKGYNGNTITNQKSKQDGTQSGFDSSSGEEGSNLICTHPNDNTICEQEGVISTTTSIPTQTTQPTDGTLLVKKVVKCENGIPCPTPSDFTITVLPCNVIPVPGGFPCNPASISKGSESGTFVTLGPGAYTVLENNFFGFYSGDCIEHFQNNTGGFGSGTINAGEHQTCIITNTCTTINPTSCERG